MNIFNKIASVVGCVLMFAACSTPYEDFSSTQNDIIEVGFELSDDATRTAIEEDGKTTRWAPGDKMAVWAKDANENYVLQNATFTMRYYSGEYDKAYFASTRADSVPDLRRLSMRLCSSYLAAIISSLSGSVSTTFSISLSFSRYLMAR